MTTRDHVPVEFGVWRIEGNKARAMPAVGMSDERRLEDLLADDVDILGLGVMIVGRQVPTGPGGFIDLLGIDAEGTLYVIELKRQRTPRDVVAQALDYGSWARGLSYEDVKEIFDKSSLYGDVAFEQAYAERFNGAPGENLNETHRLVIVASELDPSTERIVSYLTEDYGVPMNAVFFRYFRDDETGGEYIARSWLIDPNQVEAKATRVSGKRPPWNGHDYYVTFGPAEVRAWEDGRKYGFVSASGGPRWIKSLQKLSPGDRVFVHSPGNGYVGVGLVKGPRCTHNGLRSGWNATVFFLILMRSPRSPPWRTQRDRARCARRVDTGSRRERGVVGERNVRRSDVLLPAPTAVHDRPCQRALRPPGVRERPR